MVKPNWPYIKLRINRIFKPPVDLPKKKLFYEFGGGRKRGIYTHQEVCQQMCSVTGCGEQSYATWAGCADDHIMRPLCVEHDVQINVIAMIWWAIQILSKKLNNMLGV